MLEDETGSSPRTGLRVCLLAALAAQVHCSGDTEPQRRAPGGGVLGPSFWLLGDGAAGGGGSGGKSGSDGSRAGPPLVGSCDPEGAENACEVINQYGCLTGIQKCIAGAWSNCLWKPHDR